MLLFVVVVVSEDQSISSSSIGESIGAIGLEQLDHARVTFRLRH